MRRSATQALVGLYGWIERSGALERPWARRVFEWAYLAYKQLLEAGPVDALRSCVPTRSTVIDVGANIGFFTARFARWTGPGGRVIAIEPEALNRASLEARVRRAGLSGIVECVAAAAADRVGELRLALTPGHIGDHHLAEEGEPVPAVTLDALTADDERPVSLVKIDVQGAEMLVLAGAQQTIAAHKPAIYVEVDGPSLARMGSSPRELIDAIVTLGYRPYLLSRKGPVPAGGLEELAARAAERYVDVLFQAEP
jgi:FkbM family methyltransferase